MYFKYNEREGLFIATLLHIFVDCSHFACCQQPTLILPFVGQLHHAVTARKH